MLFNISDGFVGAFFSLSSKLFGRWKIYIYKKQIALKATTVEKYLRTEKIKIVGWDLHEKVYGVKKIFLFARERIHSGCNCLQIRNVNGIGKGSFRCISLFPPPPENRDVDRVYWLTE